MGSSLRQVLASMTSSIVKAWKPTKNGNFFSQDMPENRKDFLNSTSTNIILMRNFLQLKRGKKKKKGNMVPAALGGRVG